MTNNLFNLTNEMRIVALVLAKWNYDETNENRSLLVKRHHLGISLVVQRLRFCASNAGDLGSIPGWETKIPHHNN